VLLGVWVRGTDRVHGVIGLLVSTVCGVRGVLLVVVGGGVLGL